MRHDYTGTLEDYIKSAMRGAWRRGIDEDKIAKMIAKRAMELAEDKLIMDAFRGSNES